MADIVALGELLIDFAPVSADAQGYPVLAAQPGGAPCNYLAAAAAYGAKTAFLGKVGDDAFGRLLRETLSQLGVDTRGLVTDAECFTTLAFVTLDGAGDRSFSFARKPGADTLLRTEELRLELIDGAEIFHFGTLSLTDEPARSATRHAVAYATAQGKLISFDPNLRRPLWRSETAAREQMLWGLEQADIVKISDEEAEFLWGCAPDAAAEKLLADFGVSLAMVTLGAQGCLLANRSACVRVAPPQVAVADTTGAGDIFGGSAAAWLLEHKTPPEHLTSAQLHALGCYAATAASLSTQRRGGIASVPTRAEVEARLLSENRPRAVQ